MTCDDGSSAGAGLRGSVPSDDAASAVAEVRELLVAFGDRQDPQLLTMAVERIDTVVSAPGFADLDGQ